jgi:hypothetical protein
MNVIHIKNLLLQGKSPVTDQPIRINGDQIDHLVATVPSIKLHNSNSTQYYFPEAGVYLQVVFTGGIHYGETRGTLLNVTHNDPLFFYEDGIRKFPIGKDNKPLVFDMGNGYGMNLILNSIQSYEWLSKRPYFVKCEGYAPIYTKGMPKNDHGTNKILSVHDRDYKSVYLSFQPIKDYGSCDGHYDELRKAVEAGEFKGGDITWIEFDDAIRERAKMSHDAFKLRMDFEGFIRSNPIEQLNKTVDRYNDEIIKIEKYLKMAKFIRRHMKNNPGWFRKFDHISQNTVHKNSTLFREKIKIEKIISARYDLLNDHGENYKAPRLLSAVRDAVSNWSD